MLHLLIKQEQTESFKYFLRFDPAYLYWYKKKLALGKCFLEA